MRCMCDADPSVVPEHTHGIYIRISCMGSVSVWHEEGVLIRQALELGVQLPYKLGTGPCQDVGERRREVAEEGECLADHFRQ